jgi:hypothetical protein
MTIVFSPFFRGAIGIGSACKRALSQDLELMCTCVIFPIVDIRHVDWIGDERAGAGAILQTWWWWYVLSMPRLWRC